MKKIILTVALATSVATLNAQNVNIPDANFKAYLVGNSAINTNGDTEIQVSEAQAYTGAIFCPSLNIVNLTGIEAFTNVTTLSCMNNQITTLDLSNNSELMVLMCFNNEISTLTLGSNTNLQSVNCSENQLSTLDVSNCPNLTDLSCTHNAINSLDLSGHLNLTFLHCFVNQLTSLNVANGNNTNFTNFSANNNPDLTCIEVDDATYSTANWTNIGVNTSFSEDCATFLSIADNLTSNSLSIYPNPANSILHIEVKDISTISTSLNINSLNVQIVNILGATVATQKLNIGKNTVDVSQLTSGVYFIKPQSGTTVKFVKQ